MDIKRINLERFLKVWIQYPIRPCMMICSDCPLFDLHRLYLAKLYPNFELERKKRAVDILIKEFGEEGEAWLFEMLL